MKKQTVNMSRLLNIGIALSSEKNPNHLFQTILDAAMDLTGCDGGTLYVKTKEGLEFRLMITKSMHIRKGADREAIDLPPVPLKLTNVCARAALDKLTYSIADVYHNEQFDFSGPRKYDAITGYKTVSMLAVPMEDDHGEIIGVLQLINAMDETGNIIPFREEDRQVILSLASQAAIRLTAMNYSDEIVRTLNSFVQVMSTAIDARSPYNANHSKNMAKYGARFLDWLEKTENPFQMEENRRREFLMAVWLHDVGKLVIPLEVMDKESRLGSALSEIESRLQMISLLDYIDFLEHKISESEYQEKEEKRKRADELIHKANTAGFINDEVMAELEKLAAMTYCGRDGITRPLLTEKEYKALSVRKGTLTAEERSTMESHASMTSRILGKMYFSKDYRKVPLWASMHHEFLNGSGYPEHLTKEKIPLEVRLLTILDIFDALTACDRPYKPAMSVEKAFGILHAMEKDGQLDGSILALFEESKAWGENE